MGKKLRPELRKRLPPFDPSVADDAHILLDAIVAERWIDIESPPAIEGRPLTDEECDRGLRYVEIARARTRVVEAALVEYARIYPTDAARKLLAKDGGCGWWARSERVRHQKSLWDVQVTREYEYLCTLCGASIASMSSLSDRGGSNTLWRKLSRHALRCACLLVVETHEQLVYAQKLERGDVKRVGRWKKPETAPPEPRIYCAPPPR